MNRTNGEARAGWVDKVGPAIRSLRERAELPQGVLARRAGVGVSTVSRIEGGVQKASLRQLDLLCAALRVRPVELMAEAERLSKPPRRRSAA